MIKRNIASRLGTTLIMASLCATAHATNPRLTPIVRAVERAKAAVVNLHSEKTTRQGDSLFSAGKGRKVNGMGTGVVIDERGYIATNYHVVHGVDVLRATLHNGSTFDAKVIAVDQKHDMAIVKIDVSDPLPVMPTGTSSDIMLGETVIAVGNAFGYEHTVTAGIVSSLSRDVEVNEKQSYKNLIQTDASINPGNSGGPLLNLKGEIVGINVAIRAGAQRIGFAIPIDDARKIVARLLSMVRERLDRTYHGLTWEDRKSGQDRKLVFSNAEPNSPASRAGFLAGDVIVKTGTTDIVDGVDFERALLGRSAGEKIPILVKRNNKIETLTLTLSKNEGGVIASTVSASVVRTDDGEIAKKAWQKLGLRMRPLTRSEPKLIGSRYRGGMRVTDVRKGSSAMTNGIRPGDILLGLHIWETVSETDLSYVLEHPQFTSSTAPLKFYILRGRETMWGYMRPVVASR